MDSAAVAAVVVVAVEIVAADVVDSAAAAVVVAVEIVAAETVVETVGKILKNQKQEALVRGLFFMVTKQAKLAGPVCRREAGAGDGAVQVQSLFDNLS